ncbi:16228_t:CDS:1 [Funneliformis mosseae]|uniref:16228_t:CDS:1 n=1 Tax=Funneliformis mosseae TaxID=27381 RepID=A0A9N8WLC1_FUNMO|nr:16228_t:CDS:1 [Funneliformis mosseae]
MPCGSSSLGIHVMLPKDENPLTFDWRTLTNDSVKNEIIIGKDVVKNTIFRIQAKIQGFNNISCSTPSFSGQICYPAYIENSPPPPPKPPRCDEACGLIIAGALGCVSTIIAAILGFYKGSHDKL